MNLKSLSRLIMLAAMATLWLVGGLGGQAQTTCDTPENLLTNCGFEGSFRLVQGGNPRNVATGWQPWNAPRTSDMPSFQNTQPTYFASANASAQGAIPRIRSGQNAQVYFSFFETHDAGIFQQVSGIESGTELRFSIYGHVLSTQLDDLNISENPGGVALRVGIDPTGGTDALASTVLYSEAAIFYDAFRQYSVITTAKSDTVTVFVRTTVSEPVQFTYVYLDDAVLEVTPESGQPGATEEATDTPAPSNTPQPTNTTAASNTPKPTTQSSNTPAPSSTPRPSNTPQPTNIPAQTEEPSPTPEGATEEPSDTVPTATPIGATAQPTTGPDIGGPISETFPGTIIHTVQRGDTVGELAARYGSSIEAIQEANDLDDSYLIFRGQGLIIPVRIVPATETPSPAAVVVVVTATPVGASGGGTGGTDGAAPSASGNVYVVRSGDSLSNIARRFNTTVGTLVQLNGIANPNRIFAGQQLRLPVTGTGGATPDVVPTSPPSATPVPQTGGQTEATSTPNIIPTQSGAGPTRSPASYTVQPGDNLYRLALRFNVGLVALATANNISNYNLIFIGQVLSIP